MNKKLKNSLKNGNAIKRGKFLIYEQITSVIPSLYTVHLGFRLQAPFKSRDLKGVLSTLGISRSLSISIPLNE